jgi:hypothetical protein
VRSMTPIGNGYGVGCEEEGTNAVFQYCTTPFRLIRGQPVSRSLRFMLKVGLASEARSTRTSAKVEGRRRVRVRCALRRAGLTVAISLEKW